MELLRGFLFPLPLTVRPKKKENYQQWNKQLSEASKPGYLFLDNSSYQPSSPQRTETCQGPQNRKLLCRCATLSDPIWEGVISLPSTCLFRLPPWPHTRFIRDLHHHHGVPSHHHLLPELVHYCPNWVPCMTLIVCLRNFPLITNLGHGSPHLKAVQKETRKIMQRDTDHVKVHSLTAGTAFTWYTKPFPEHPPHPKRKLCAH